MQKRTEPLEEFQKEHLLSPAAEIPSSEPLLKAGFKKDPSSNLATPIRKPQLPRRQSKYPCSRLPVIEGNHSRFQWLIVIRVCFQGGTGTPA